jgi:hypothetical protein
VLRGSSRNRKNPKARILNDMIFGKNPKARILNDMIFGKDPKARILNDMIFGKDPKARILNDMIVVKNPKARILNDMIVGNLANPDLFCSSTKLVDRRVSPGARATPYRDRVLWPQERPVLLLLDSAQGLLLNHKVPLISQHGVKEQFLDAGPNISYNMLSSIAKKLTQIPMYSCAEIN